MKKVNFNIPVVDMDRAPVVVDGKEMLVKNIIANKIGQKVHDSNFEESLKNWKLAKRVVESKAEIQINDEESVFIKQNLGGLPVFIVGQILEILK